MYRPQDSGKFLCPLCHRFFSKEAIDRKELSIEHVVPEKLGGRVTTLTCTSCNNQAGTKLDARLIDRLRFEDWTAGQSSTPMTSRVEVGDAAGWFNAEVSITHDGMQIRGLPRNSSP